MIAATAVDACPLFGHLADKTSGSAYVGFSGKADIATARCALEFVDASGGNNASKSISLRIAAIGRNMFGKPWTGLERANCWMLQSGSSGTVLAETGFAVQLVIWRNSQPNRSVSIGRDFGIK